MPERYNNIIEFKEISSTNDYAMELVRKEFVPDFTVIKTDFQTNGRGQIGNCWVSNYGENLLFSVVLHPKKIFAVEQFILSQCVSLALRDVIARYCKNVYVKWPNDIYVGNKKVAGILIENLLMGRKIESSVVGIGLNVNQTEFPPLPNPTSMKLETGMPFDKQKILKQFLSAFRLYYKESLLYKGRIRRKYLKNLYLFQEIRIFRDGLGEFEGKIISVENDGKLHILDTFGKEREYYFKEVEYVLSR